MFVAAYRNTERSIAFRKSGMLASLHARLAEEHEKSRPQIKLVRPANPYRPTVQRLELKACRLFGTNRAELHSQRRSDNIVNARQFVMYWSFRLTSLSASQIGRQLKRDHTTVLHGKIAYVEKRARMGRTLRSL